jgi:hypothetical protein
MREFGEAIAACGGGDPAAIWGPEGSGQHRMETALVRKQPRRRPLWIGIVGGAAVAGGAVLWWQLRAPASKVDSPPPVAPSVVAPAPPPSAPTPPPVETAPVEHEITIETVPKGAEVFRGDERLGVTDGVFKLAHGSAPIELRIAMKGYKDYTLQIHPDHNGRYKPGLEPLPRHAPAAPISKKASPRPEAPRPETKPEPPPRAEQPKHHQADLIDPFSGAPK